MSSGPQGDRNVTYLGNQHVSTLDIPMSNNSSSIDLDGDTSDDAKSREILILRQENKALQDLTKRHQAELKIYQQKYPNEQITVSSLDLGDDLPPWISQSRFVAPLLVAYERRIHDLTQRNLQQQRELTTLKGEAETWIKRNQQLERDVEANINNLVKQFERASPVVADGKGGQIPATAVPDEIKELQEHIGIYREQLEIMRSQEEDLQHQIVQLLQQNQELMTHREMQDAKLSELGRVDAVKDQLAEQVQTLNAQSVAILKDKERIQNHLKEVKIELKTRVYKHQEYRKKQEGIMTQMKEDVDKLRLELTQYNQREIDYQSRIEHFEKELELAEDRERKQKRDLEANQRDIESMVASLEQLENTLNQYKQKESDMTARENACADKVYTAELRRDQAIAIEDAFKREIERLNKHIDEEQKEHEQRAQDSITKLYTKAKETEEKLLEELRNMQLVCAELDVQKENAVREQKSLQLRYEKLAVTSETDYYTVSNELQEIKTTVMESKNEAKRLQGKAERAVAELKLRQEEWQRERKVLSQQMKEARAIVDDRELQYKAIKQENIKLKDLLERKAREMSQLQVELKERIEHHNMDNKTLMEVKDAELSELHDRLEEAYQLHEDAEERLNAMIAEKEALSNKWRSESRESLLQFQRIMQEQKEVTSRAHSKNVQLNQQLATALRQKEEAAMHQTEHEEIVKHLKLQLTKSKERMEPLTTRLNECLQREKELMSNTIKLQSQLDRAQLEQSRAKRQSDNTFRRMQFQRESDKYVAERPFASDANKENNKSSSQ